jgi:Sugar (and other) transporter
VLAGPTLKNLHLMVKQIISVITPYMVDKDKGNLGAKVFFIWGSLCFCCFIYSWFLVYETKGLSLEQYVCRFYENFSMLIKMWCRVDKMMAESTPMSSSKWRPTSTFAHELAVLGNKPTHSDAVTSGPLLQP